MSNRGFASMSPEQRRAIASMGGKAAQSTGKAHRWTAESAKEAGQKGGKSLVTTRGSAHMADIGSKGGKMKAGNATPAAGIES
jgi:general stress protein YciG